MSTPPFGPRSSGSSGSRPSADDSALDHQRERLRLRVVLALQLLADAQPVAAALLTWGPL